MEEAARDQPGQPHIGAARSANDGVQLAVAVLASLALLFVIWSVDYFPSHHGPERLFQGHLLNHFSDAGTSYGLYLQPGAPVSGLGFVLLFSALERVMSWASAYRAVLSVTCLGWSWACFWLARSLHRERGWLGLFGFGSALGWPLFMGMFSLVLSLALSFLVVGLAIRRPSYDAKTRVILGALLTLQALVHVFGALVTGLVLVLLVLSGHAGAKRWRELGWLVLQSLPTLGVLYVLIAAHPLQDGAVWLPFLERLELTPRLMTGGPFWRGGPFVLLGVIGTCWGAVRSQNEEASAAEKALAGASFLLWIGTLAAPSSVLHLDLFAPRFLAPAALLGGMLIPVETAERGAVRAVAIATITLHSLGAIGWAALFVRDVDERLSSAWTGLDDRERRHGPRLAVVLDPYAGLASRSVGNTWRGVAMPYFAPLHDLGMIYAIEQGGIPTDHLADHPRIDSFVVSPEGQTRLPPAFSRESLHDADALADPAKRTGLITWLALVGRGYEDLLFKGRLSDITELKARGYVPSVATNSLLLGRFRGCAVTLGITGLATDDVGVSMEQGFGDQNLRPRPLDASKASKRALKVRIEKTLCGAGWIRISEDTDRSGGRSEDDRVCSKADRGGRLHYAANDGEVTLRCQLAPPTR